VSLYSVCQTVKDAHFLLHAIFAIKDSIFPTAAFHNLRVPFAIDIFKIVQKGVVRALMSVIRVILGILEVNATFNRFVTVKNAQ
jgi:hypothetical protein